MRPEDFKTDVAAPMHALMVMRWPPETGIRSLTSHRCRSGHVLRARSCLRRSRQQPGCPSRHSGLDWRRMSTLSECRPADERAFRREPSGRSCITTPSKTCRIRHGPGPSSLDSSLEENGFEISVPRYFATANSVGAFISAGQWRFLEPPKQLYRFAEADDPSGDSAAPTVDRPQPDRSLKTAA